MKKIVLSAAIGLVTFTACSQDVAVKDVPSVISNAFNASFKNATGADWEKKNGNYEVEFEISNVDHSVLYNASGKVLMHKQDVAANALPASLSTLLSSTYKNHQIDDIELVERNGKRYFQLEAEEGNKEQKLVFTDTGAAAADVDYWD